MKPLLILLASAAVAFGQSPTKAPMQPLPTGVEVDKIGTGKYVVNGHAATKQQAYEAIESGGVDDISTKKRITIIGTADECAKAQLAMPADVAKWAVVKCYKPDDWYPRDNGFVCTGSPTIYVQNANGEVIHRQDNLDGIATAINKANPGYDPKSDPDLRRGIFGGLNLNLNSVGTIAVILSIGAGLALFGRPATKFLWTNTIGASMEARRQAAKDAADARAKQDAKDKMFMDTLAAMQNSMILLAGGKKPPAE